jgi:hypothetical protein
MDPHRPVAAILSELAMLRHELAERAAFEEAIGLAFQERTGEELADGGEYTEADADRAMEILRLYPAAGA